MNRRQAWGTAMREIQERESRTARRTSPELAQIVLLSFFMSASVAKAQVSTSAYEPSFLQAQLSASSSRDDQSARTLAEPCVQPPPTVSWRDYEGPFAKVVGVFGRRLERRSVHPFHYKPGAKLCTLDLKDKFTLFAEDAVDPVTFLNAGFNAGIGQAENSDPSFGQGTAGYGKRFGANMADQVSSEFFKDFAYPSMFSEDPRYYRLAHGSTGKRLLHAASHSIIAYNENGTRMFNFSEWLGTASAVALSNVYHPDNHRGVAPATRRIGFGVGGDIGFDVLREFWPDLAGKFKLPFKDRNEPRDR